MANLVLGDIVGSRNHDLKRVWQALNEIAQNINSQFELDAPMVITLGDEFQMVCQNKAQAFVIIETINQALGKANLVCRYVLSPFSLDTSAINSLDKFNKIMNSTLVNPLLCPEFKAAHRQLDLKHQGTYEI